MKHIRKICILVALVMAFMLTVSAQQDGLKVSNATAEKDKIIYLTVELTQPVEGNTASVKYSFDETLLKPVVESCQWLLTDGMKNFNNKNAGVWSVERTTEIKGALCILAFRLQDGADFTKTQVNCEVQINNGAQKVDSYSDVAVITMACNHSYGEWKDAGDFGHTKSCTLCQGEQTQSHQWNQGIVTKDPNSGGNVITYTCQVCGGTTSHETSEKATVPTMPESNEPTAPQKKPGSTEPTRPGQSGSVSGKPEEDDAPNLPPQNVDGNAPGKNTSPTEDPHAGHNHNQTQQGGSGGLTAAVLCVVFAAFLGTAIYFLKKKK